MTKSSDPSYFTLLLDTEGLKRRAINSSLITAVSQGMKMAVQIGSQIALARLLFPSDFGLLAMVYPIIGFIQVFNDLGLGQILVQRPGA